MKNRNIITKHRLNAIAIGFLASSSLVMAANYSTLDHQQDNFTNLDQIAPETTEQGRSISTLESFQQAEQSNKRANYLEVLNLLKQNKIEEAQNKISSLLKQNPNEADYYNLKALLETLKKDTSAAQQNYEKAIKLDPKNILAYLGSAKLALDGGQLDKAREYANQALAINDKAINGYLVLADVAYKQKDNAEVEKLLLTAQEKVKGTITAEIEVIKNLSKYYSIQKQPDKILALTEELQSRYPDNSLALSLLAQAQIINDKKPLAEQTLLKLINVEKQDAGSRLLLIKLMSEHPDKVQETLNLLDETAQITPNNPEALVYKTAYLIKLKRTQEALELANKIDKQFPKLVLGKLLKGDVYLAEKKLDKATDMYQQAYKIEQNDRVLFTLADLLSAQKKEPEAIKLLNNALEKNKKNIAIHFKLANIYQRQNDTKQAEAHYNAMLSEQADNVLALNNLAFLYSQQNDPRALELAKKAYEKAPESAAILDTYGYILFKQGQPKESLTILEKA
ncbi:MAG: tetratricopeptide repeat protein, partial [Methylococcaceae bacterium]|nr:tetratricopeptide repeat protein [Methylococcaceae bacterium]